MYKSIENINTSIYLTHIRNRLHANMHTLSVIATIKIDCLIRDKAGIC